VISADLEAKRIVVADELAPDRPRVAMYRDEGSELRSFTDNKLPLA
jgi:hypothetical protein